MTAVRGRSRRGDLVLVPVEAVYEDGIFLDDLSVSDLGREVGVPVAAGWDPLLFDPQAEQAGRAEPLSPLEAMAGLS